MRLKFTSIVSMALVALLLLTACSASLFDREDKGRRMERTSGDGTTTNTVLPTPTTTVNANPSTTSEVTEASATTTESTTTEVDRRVRLEVPQIVQEEWNYCAPATVAMILAYRGVEVTQDQLAKEMLTDETFGTHNTEAIRVLNHYLFGYDAPDDTQQGYRLATVTSADPASEDMRLFIERLIQNIADGYPLYFTVDNAKIYENSHGEHNVVVTGYKLDPTGEEIIEVYFIDPSYYQQDEVYGGLKTATPEELLGSMLTCEEPNYGW